VRSDGRMADELRPLTIERDYTRYAEGSVLVCAGQSRVICTAMVEDGVPMHCREKEMGWVTAEYCMLPSANPERRSLQRGPGGREQEIQRLIGRSLRAAVDLYQLGERTIWIDCNVIQADGGTRTAAITGGFVALVDALLKMKEREQIPLIPLKWGVAAVSVGIVEGMAMLDLSADEDRCASVDMNVVMTHEGTFIEVQGCAEQEPFSPDELKALLELAERGIKQVKDKQLQALGGALPGQGANGQ